MGEGGGKKKGDRKGRQKTFSTLIERKGKKILRILLLSFPLLRDCICEARDERRKEEEREEQVDRTEVKERERQR